MKKPEENLSNKIDTVVALAEHWKDSMPKKPGKRMESGQWREWDGLIKLLSDFSKFARDYKRFLLKVSAPNECFTMNNGTQRLLQNFNTLSRASEQRRGAITTDSLAYYLAEAEDILDEYCSRWQPRKDSQASYVKLKTPVAYFEKTYGISRALYAPEIPVISIPLTEYNDPDRWLALAHEYGHHIYYNALCTPQKALELHNGIYRAVAEVLKPCEEEMLELWKQWMDEVFADICGVLLGGPEYVISAQNVAAEKIRKSEDLAKTDGEHTIPYLRPSVASETLRNIQGQNSNVTAFLEEAERRWKNYCDDTSQLVCTCGKDKKKIPVESLQEQVVRVVDIILNKPVWPDGQCLKDLVSYVEWDRAPGEIASLPPFSRQDSAPVPKLLDLDGYVPGMMREIWTFLQDQLPGKDKMTEEERAGKCQDALVNLSLTDDHGHGTAGLHEDPQSHSFLYWSIDLHRHDQDSGRVLPP